MTPEGPEDLLLVDGALVWPPGEGTDHMQASRFTTSQVLYPTSPPPPSANLISSQPQKQPPAFCLPCRQDLREIFSSTLQIVRAESAPCDAEE